jgi:hypothetical protein
MAVITFEDVIPTLIENTNMIKGFRDGVHMNYRISPIDGYVLHDNSGNWTDMDGIEHEAYYTGTVSCAASYDFETNPREFYAVPEDSVPADQIFGGVKPEVEVM